MSAPVASRADVTVIGAGLAGLATAYFLTQSERRIRIQLVDQLPPMSFTSARSGDNFRNWWPHPTMTAFTDASIDLMEAIAAESDIGFCRGGYVLVTRENEIDDLVTSLEAGYAKASGAPIQVYDGAGYLRSANKYGVDVVTHADTIRRTFPQLDPAIRAVIHVRRAGHFSGQQMGQFMLVRTRECGARLLRGKAISVDRSPDFRVTLEGGDTLLSERLVIAAGPFVNELVAQLEEPLPVANLLQQKLAFADRAGAVPRDQPFTIDLDELPLDWAAAERESIEAEPELSWLAGSLPSGLHCRPEGSGQWIKLGWAFNRIASEPLLEAPLDPLYPEIVVRRAGLLNPALKVYRDRLPRQRSHYGGYYTMTEENWPLIGPLRTEGAFVVGALSGFGTMAACAAGSLCSDWITDAPLPSYAEDLSPARYENQDLIEALRGATNKGIV